MGRDGREGEREWVGSTVSSIPTRRLFVSYVYFSCSLLVTLSHLHHTKVAPFPGIVPATALLSYFACCCRSSIPLPSPSPTAPVCRLLSLFFRFLFCVLSAATEPCWLSVAPSPESPHVCTVCGAAVLSLGAQSGSSVYFYRLYVIPFFPLSCVQISKPTPCCRC